MTTANPVANVVVANMSTKTHWVFGKFVKRAKVKPAAVLDIAERQKGNIESCEIVAPKLGEKDFGSIEVSFRMPVSDAELCPTR